MDNAELKAFIYALHYKVENMQTWAKTVEEAITDHATHIDVTTRRATNSFRLVETETTALTTSICEAAATAERGTREVMKCADNNDAKLKAKISSVVGSIELQLGQNKSEVAKIVCD